MRPLDHRSQPPWIRASPLASVPAPSSPLVIRLQPLRERSSSAPAPFQHRPGSAEHPTEAQRSKCQRFPSGDERSLNGGGRRQGGPGAGVNGAGAEILPLGLRQKVLCSSKLSERREGSSPAINGARAVTTVPQRSPTVAKRR